jgi:predicted Rdx family selenoprotein
VADEILTDYQHVINEFTFLMGTKGAFEFKVDGELLYSKKTLKRHAEPGEVLDLFKEFIGPDVKPYPRDK